MTTSRVLFVAFLWAHLVTQAASGADGEIEAESVRAEISKLNETIVRLQSRVDALEGRLDAAEQCRLVSLIQALGGEDHHGDQFAGRNRTIHQSNFLHNVQRSKDAEVIEAFFDRPSHKVLDDPGLTEYVRVLRDERLPVPRGLCLSGLPVSDSGIRQVARLGNLESLHIDNCPDVTNESIQYLQALKKLKHLSLSGTSVDDRGLAFLSELTELRELSLIDTKVTDDGLANLRGLTKLEYLRLSRTNVSVEGIKTLESQLPDCQITY